MNVAIFTDNDFGKLNGVTTTLTAALDCAPSGMQLRVYTAAALPVEAPDYLALKSIALPVPFYGELNMFVPRFQAYIARAREDRIDVVHLTTPGPIGLAAVYTAWRLQLPMVGSFHTDLAASASVLSGSPRLGALMREYMRWVYGKCSRVLVPSDATRRLLIDARMRADCIQVWRRGVDTSRFSPERRSRELRRQWHVSDNRPALLYVGRVSREKGLELLPQLQRRLYARHLKHRFIIVGYSPMLDELRRQMPDALFTGALSRQEVAVAAAGGPRENMVDGSTGIMCRHDDPDVWADAIARFVNPALRPTYANAARAYALGREWTDTLEPLYRAYREVAAVTAPASAEVHGAVV
jgi:phosphatidylinositol alpha 1,6-mannosyltransferase